MSSVISLVDPGTTNGNSNAVSLEPLVTVSAFAAFLHVSPQTVRDMVHRGELPGARINKRIYIIRDEFIERLKAGEYGL